MIFKFHKSDTFRRLLPSMLTIALFATGVPFGSHGQTLDIWAPNAMGDAPLPVVIFWYGGGWAKGDRASYAFAGRALAKAGFLVVIPDYRKVPAVRFPTFLDDGAEAVAWTHTVSAGQRFTFYELQLDPESPTTYLYDGEPRDMVPTDHTIQVKRADGTLGEETRRLWRSHYGPILNIDPVGWTNSMVFTYRDANIGNRTLISQLKQ